MKTIFDRTKNSFPHLRVWMVVLLLCFCTVVRVSAAGLMSDLTQYSLEDLMNIEFTTLARRQQRISETAAAAYVITPEDIRRSGATNIPEALRMVPGLQVARLASDKWAVSVRGFNNLFSNKLLVLMDGRTVYSGLNSGVYWSVEDTLIEDIARIEVIRGPGASLWGANAVNGVINIVTRPADQSQGGLARATAGTEERFLGALRYGGSIGNLAGGSSAHYSSYVKYDQRDGTISADGNDQNDSWYISRGAGRADWQVNRRDKLTFQGDLYESKDNLTTATFTPAPPYQRVLLDSEEIKKGHNLSGRWERTYSQSSDLALQASYSHTKKTFLEFNEQLDIYDVDFQHRLSVDRRQELMWGLNLRISDGLTESSSLLYFDPANQTDYFYSCFIQDDIVLLPARLSLIVGSKFEHNDFTGWEVLPNARLLWTPHHQHSFWASVSRAVRTPSRFERNAQTYQAIPGVSDALAAIYGNQDLQPETLTAYEAGYRFLPGRRFGLDLAFFYNEYDALLSWAQGDIFFEVPSGRFIVPFVTVNGMEGTTYGGELSLNWQPHNRWRLQGAYSYLQMDLHDPYSENYFSEITEGENPEHQVSLRSTLDLSRGLELDLWLKYVDELPAVTQKVPAYCTMDARIGWQASTNWSFDLVGQNLINSSHPEFASEIWGVRRSEIERGVYLKATWRF